MPFTAVISLGPTCSTKYQIGRYVYFKTRSDPTEDGYRRLIWSDQRKPFGTCVFDWQITPVTAVLRYLELDFVGVFEREDLVVAESGDGAFHQRLQVRHAHSFHAPEGAQLTEKIIDEQYPQARQKFDHLAKKLSLQLRSSEPTLYVLREFPHPTIVSQLISLLSDFPDHPFHLLLVGFGEPDEDYRFGAQVSTAVVLERSPRKPESHQWEGNDEAWDSVLENSQ